MNDKFQKDIVKIRGILKPNFIYSINLYLLPVSIFLLMFVTFTSFLNSFIVMVIYLIVIAYFVITELVYSHISSAFKDINLDDMNYLNVNISKETKIIIFGVTDISDFKISKYELINLINCFEKNI